MSVDCALNIIPTGDYVDNTEWPQKSIYSISSSCDNRTPTTWYLNETDEATQVTMMAPIAADAGLQTINESGDFTKEQNKICIHNLNENINGHLPTNNECEDAENTLTKIWRREFNNIKKCFKNEIYETSHLSSLLQDDVHNKDFTRKEAFEQFDEKILQNVYDSNKDNIKMLKKKTRKSSSLDSFENFNDYFVRKNKDKTLQSIPINIGDKMDEKINKNIYKHVPHKDRPPLIVARRNARERRRVQAVNSAFMRLRKIVPLGSNRGKRISKVKTLQTAIDYISSLQELLKQTDMYDLDIISDYRCCTNDYHRNLDDFDNEF